MKKTYLESVIEKYHLGGLVERAKIQIIDKTLTTKFISSQKNLVGILEAPDIELPDCEFGIYDTSQLLKLIGITNNFVTLDVKMNKGIANKLLIADNEYDLEYVLADVMLTPSIPSVDEPVYNIVANMDEEFVTRFLKAKKAINTESFTIEQTYDFEKNPMLSFTLGGETYSNKINFTIKAQIFSSSLTSPITFPIKEFSEILLANKEFELGILNINKDGLIKIEFEDKSNVKSTYLLVGKE